MYINKPLGEYLDELTARKPAPGGGSAAALGASIGAALLSMVLNYTVGNEKYKDVQEKAVAILVKIEKFRNQLQGLIDEDVAVYNKLAKALKQKKRDPDSLEVLRKEAADVPFEVCRISSECLKLCKEAAECGNENLITDSAIAAIMFEGAFLAAKFNVYINLKYIKDMEYIGEVHKVLAPLEKEMPKLKEEIIEKCEDVISK